jgi:acyl carrier protein
MDVEKQFYEILIKYLNIEEEDILITTRLEALEPDFLEQMKIKILCEDKFNIEMDDEVFENNSTIEEIIEELEELIVD